jgi:hypothetical protein
MSNTVLTDAQYALLYTDIMVTHAGEFAADVAANNDQVIADAYNAIPSPNWWVWRTAVTRDEFLFSTGAGGTYFEFAGSAFVTLTVQALMLFESLFDSVTGVANPSIDQWRYALSTALGSGSANDTHIRNVSKRVANRVEKLLSAGTGSNGSPAVLGYEGTLRHIDIAHTVRNVPL